MRKFRREKYSRPKKQTNSTKRIAAENEQAISSSLTSCRPSTSTTEQPASSNSTLNVPSSSSNRPAGGDDTSAKPNIKEKFLKTLDHLDKRVDIFRKDTYDLIKKRDFLFTCIDLLKSDDSLSGATKAQKKQVETYTKQLEKLTLNVETLRSPLQEKSLYEINAQINAMISLNDPAIFQQRCQTLLNTCCDIENKSGDGNLSHNSPIDKNFENLLLSCTLDDQKYIKERLKALIGYKGVKNSIK